MELGAIDPISIKSKALKQSNEDSAKVSFKDTLVTKMGVQAGAVAAAEKTHEQTLMKAKQKKNDKNYDTQDEEDAAQQQFKKLKQKLTNLLNSERHISGI